MMKGRNRRRFLISGVIVVVLSAGCPNNLLDTIEEEVEIIVTPPTIESLFPNADAANVNIDIDNIYITFTKGIDSDSISSGTLIVKNTANTADTSDDTTVQGTYSVSNRTVNFNPSTALNYQTTYSVTVTNLIRDVDGNSLVNQYSWSFSTEEAPAGAIPTIESFSINSNQSATNQDMVYLDVAASNATNVSGELQVRYRETDSDIWSDWVLLTNGIATINDVSLGITEDETELFEYEAQVKDSRNFTSLVKTAAIMYETEKPIVLETSPVGTSVPGNTSVARIVFNEEMAPLSIDTTLVYVEDSDGNQLENTVLNFGKSNEIPNAVVEITELHLEQFKTYYIVVSNDITDIAGNIFGTEERYEFATGSAADNDPPEVEITINTLNSPGTGATKTILSNGLEATNWDDLGLTIDATDDFNGIKDMKIWSQTENEPASYSDYSGSYSVDLDPTTLSGGPNSSNAGIKYIYYKVRDWALNEAYGYKQIVLDCAAPVLSFSINGGAGYSTDIEGKVDIAVEATDELPSGEKLTGITYMAYSEDSADLADGSESWFEFSDEIAQFAFSIPDGEVELPDGEKTIYMKVKDYLDQSSSIISRTITLDREAPVITINESDYLEVNSAATQIASVSDNTDLNPAASWDQVEDQAGGVVSFSNPNVVQPSVSADIDGNYTILLTATDGAGNSSSLPIPFIWDTTDPEDTLTITTEQYNNDGQPEWTWPAVEGADRYLFTFDAAPDWNDLSSMTYYETGLTSWAPDTALADNSYTLHVTAWDNAGNMADTESTATVQVDTIKPGIEGGGQVFLTNSNFGIDFTGGDGSINDGSGSGIDESTVLWSQTSGSGTLIFDDPSSRSPSLSTTDVAVGERAVFGIALSVTDNAGNENSAEFTVDWDREPPIAPDLDAAVGWDPDYGTYHTPDTTPTWFWNSGGNGGAGNYEYRLDGGDWTPTALNSFEAGPLSAGSDQQAYTHTLELREYDAAGNPSPESSLGVWVDGNYIASPSVISDRAPVTNQGSITWSWSSGAGEEYDTNLFRFTVNGSGYLNPSGSGGDNVLTYYHDVSGQSAGTVVDYNFQVEEYHGGVWQGVENGKYGTNTVTVDLQGPDQPSVSGSDKTNDTTPTWYWSTNGFSDGVGIFQYQLDGTDDLSWSDDTTQTSWYPTSPLSDTGHTLYVREQDPLGNWSDPASFTTTIDITPPTLNSVTINGGDAFTGSRTGLVLAIDAVYESGMTMSVLDYDPAAAWEPFETFTSTKTVSVPDGEGYKSVYVRLKDDVGNISSYKYDTIILDTTAPGGSILINGGASTTPSYYGYFDASASDNYSSSSQIDVQHACYNEDSGSWFFSSWETVGTNLYIDRIFSNGTGNKVVYARFKDGAGNISAPDTTDPSVSGSGWVSDYIYMQVPTMRFAYKGVNSNGAVNVYYNEVTDPPGDYVNRYYIYSTTDPNLVPTTSTSGLTYEGSADQSAGSYATIYVPTGELRYFWVRTYNSDSRGYGYFNPVPSVENANLGFSSNVTVIYDDDETKDTEIAVYLKELLEDTYFTGSILDEANMAGTMPSYSVTLLPEDLINNTTYSTFYRIYGDPIIVTPGTSFSRTSDTYDIRVRNIVSSGKGLIAMGYYGLSILDRIEDNWSAWSLSGTAPTQIGAGESMGLTAATTGKSRPASISESIWHAPMQNTYLSSNYSESSVTLSLFGSIGNVSRQGVYLPTASITDGYIYAGDPNYSTYYPVVRQGRFLQYGYWDVPGRNYTGAMTYQYGQPFFINLVARMDDF